MDKKVLYYVYCHFNDSRFDDLGFESNVIEVLLILLYKDCIILIYWYLQQLPCLFMIFCKTRHL